MTTDVPAVQIRGLAVAYDLNPVLWNVSLDIATGSIMAIVGPNGAGKSTLLKSVLGLIPALAGRVEVFGKRFRHNRQQIGYVPQRTEVDWDFPTTVEDMVLMGTFGQLGWFRRPGAAERKRAREALDKVELRDLADRQIGELSGGQQQRAFLARAFVQDAPVLFMDEPFAGVDMTTEKTLARLLREFCEQGKTIAVVHHDLLTVGEYFDSVTLLNKEVIASGSVAAAFTDSNLAATYGGIVPNLEGGGSRD